LLPLLNLLIPSQAYNISSHIQISMNDSLLADGAYSSAFSQSYIKLRSVCRTFYTLYMSSGS
jgi:hypothetical protein